jgi:cytochrome c556
MKSFIHLASACALLAVSVSASAQFAKPEDSIRYRQSSLFIMGQHFARIGAMANGRAPFDAKVAAENAEIVATMAKLPWAGFGPGTDKGAPTKAKAEIWSEQVKFREAGEKTMAETAKLGTVSISVCEAVG